MTSDQPRLRAAHLAFSPNRLLTASSLLLLCGLAACGRVPGQFQIINNQVPTGNCSIPVNESVYQGQGRLDARLVRSGAESAFYVFPLLENNFPGSPGDDIDTNMITLTSFGVDISVLTAPPATTTLIDALNANAST